MEDCKNILGIESSCDDTSAAVMCNGVLVGQATNTQEVHAAYGGVVPEKAARAHQNKIVPIVQKALQSANLPIQAIDAIAVTQGPGLLGSLLVGTSFANGLALGSNIPMLGIHHTRAHLLANLIEKPRPTFPFLGLVISGGHTQLVEVRHPLDMQLLGTTRDDAVGEAFDKIARMMNMPYPGGVHIDRHAIAGNPNRFTFPIPNVAGLDFSFSGIKTSFLYQMRKLATQDADFLTTYHNDLCASVQYALVTSLMLKLTAAVAATKLQRVVLGGGVANNTELQRRLTALAAEKGWELFIPRPSYTTDNAAMIAMAGHCALKAGMAPVSSVTPHPRMRF
ncbi:MAG: tRNA (adenosine(37)-N6)-threonylcarbamoyltransferase complex transferase subunit TsaD [Cytophagales bacterium]